MFENTEEENRNEYYLNIYFTYVAARCAYVSISVPLEYRTARSATAQSCRRLIDVYREGFDVLDNGRRRVESRLPRGSSFGSHGSTCPMSAQVQRFDIATTAVVLTHAGDIEQMNAA